jgi:hypothetical protein
VTESTGPAAPDAAHEPHEATGEERCPACGAPPSPGRWCMACGKEFDAAPKGESLPPGGAVEVRKFQCDGCGALLLFDAATDKLLCGFCGNTRAIPRDEGWAAPETAIEEAETAAPRRSEETRTFRCDSCGAEVVFAPNVVADNCPFCGSSHVVEGAGDPSRIRPVAVVPFTLAEADARARWAAWLRRGLFRPRALRRSSVVEALRGVYVPFWTFDTKTWSRWTADAGYHYTTTVTVGGRTETQTHTRWVPASGERRDEYDDVLVCASKGVDERMLGKTYPYRLEEARSFREEYLSGWNAEEYAVDVGLGWSHARERVNAEEVSKCAGDVPGDTHRSLRVWTQHASVTWKHLLLPVWVAAYRYRDKTWVFLVNGQTGKVAGRAPVSWVRVALAVLLAAGVGAAIWWLLERR